jgi:hypothetical protein
MSDKVNANRRDFMKAAGVGAAVISSLGLSAAEAAVPPPAKWDEETDVLVLGYGGAGANTAINAADAGADVLILEKNPADLHVCNTNVAGGLLICATDVEKGFQYIKACIGDTVDDAMCRLWAEQTLVNPAYLKKLADAVGVPSDIMRYGPAEFPDLPGADGISIFVMKAGPGAKIFEVLDKNVKARKNIRVAFSSPGKKIVQTANGEVLGIIAERNGKEYSVRGKRATVLSSGGYEFNERLKLNSLFANPRHFYGTDSNTGDGLLMAMAAGADLWHMNWTSQHYGFAYKNFPVGMAFDTMLKASFMVVDQYGKRFFNDSYNGHSSYLYFCYYDPLKGVYPRLPAYLIFDETMRLMGAPLSSSVGVGGGIVGAKTAKYKYVWSKDQSAEIEKGWIMKADTIEDLVKAINARQGPNDISDYRSSVKMDPAALVASVNTFNGYAAQHSDPEFGRRSLAPIQKGPFYATEVWPCGPNTQGGPRFNANGQVVDPFGTPIPRLYKCGELGSIYGERYPGGGGNITELLAFGRIVGQNAAKEPTT